MTGPPMSLIAGHVDRLVVAVHRDVAVGHRDEIRPAVERAALGAPGHVIDLAEFVAAGRCTSDVVRRRFPYESTDVLATVLDDLARHGVLDTAGPAHGDLGQLVDVVIRTRASVAAALWRGDLESAREGAGAALRAASGPLVVRFRELPQPATPAHELHHRLNGLRYARLDAHVMAWTERGLSAEDIVVLDEVLAGRVAGPTPALLARGWVDETGTATATGRAARADIEATTDRRCDAMFGAVSDPGRWVAALASLPPR